MTLAELRALLAAAQTERAAIYQAAETRFADSDDDTEVRGAFVLDADGNPTSERDAHAGLTETEVERLAELDAEEATLRSRVERAEHAERIAARTPPAAASPVYDAPNVSRTITADAFDYETVRNARTYDECRGQIVTALEEMRGVTDPVREAIVARMDQSAEHDDDSAAVARLAVTRINPAYRSAFRSYITGRYLTHGYTDAERAALEQVADAQYRAAITIDTGLAFPTNVDPQFLMVGTNTISSIRNLCEQRSGTSPTHYVNTMAAASFGKAVDGAESGDATGADDSVTMTTQLAHGTIVYSMSARASMASLEADLIRSAQKGIGNTEASDMLTGDGVAPNAEGVLDGTTITRVSSAATTLASADLYNVVNAVPAEHQIDAAWLFSNPTGNAIRQLESSGGAQLWHEMGSTPMERAIPRGLLGFRVAQHSGMNGPTSGKTFTTGHDIAVVGDWKEGYRVYDQLGTATVSNVPFLTGTTANLPNGTSGLYVRWRYAAGITNANALRVLDIV